MSHKVLYASVRLLIWWQHKTNHKTPRVHNFTECHRYSKRKESKDSHCCWNGSQCARATKRHDHAHDVARSSFGQTLRHDNKYSTATCALERCDEKYVRANPTQHSKTALHVCTRVSCGKDNCKTQRESLMIPCGKGTYTYTNYGKHVSDCFD